MTQTTTREALLAEALRNLIDDMAPPAPNCACHLSAPCGDCTEYGGMRHLIAEAEAALATQPPAILPPPLLLEVARRNLPRHIEGATFRNPADKMAALNCLEVMEQTLAALAGPQVHQLPREAISWRHAMANADTHSERRETIHAMRQSAREMLRALEAAIDCGMVPISSASDGGASRHSLQVRVADQIRAAVANAAAVGLSDTAYFTDVGLAPHEDTMRNVATHMHMKRLRDVQMGVPAALQGEHFTPDQLSYQRAQQEQAVMGEALKRSLLTGFAGLHITGVWLDDPADAADKKGSE